MIGAPMTEKCLMPLGADQEFKKLIPPLSRKEYQQLEENLLDDGCRDPIIIWNGVIVDGHNRYEICMKHKIPFAIIEKNFTCREEAIAWICANQLGRRNVSEETRKYLIGKQYETTKITSRIKNPQGKNQYYRTNRGTFDHRPNQYPSKCSTANEIAKANRIARGTVEKYAIYSRAVDTIAEKDPEIVPKILSGQYKIAHNNIVELSKLNKEDIKKVERKIQQVQEPYVKYNRIRAVLNETQRKAKEGESVPTVKDMPAFDPDADINSLTLTIPSWISSINRVHTKTDLSIISSQARKRLINELYSLFVQIEELLDEIERGGKLNG